MTAVRGQPPGRSGRLWLARRLDTARRGASLLDRKLTILRQEQARFTEHAGRSRSLWHRRVAEAETWLVRAALIAGEAGVRSRVGAHAGDGEAQVDLRWAAVMGVRYPASAAVTPAGEASDGPLLPTAALLQASEAYRAALQAAVEHAVAQAATRVIAQEVDATRLRLRAIEDRWVPRLEASAAELALALAELEGAEQARLRRAVHDGVGRPRGPGEPHSAANEEVPP